MNIIKILAGIFLGCAPARAAIVVADTTAALEALIAQAPPGPNTAVATDLDNTLLELDRDLGSEHWFLWQKDLIEHGRAAEAAAPDVQSLLKLQSMLYAISPAHLVDPRLKTLYAGVTAAGGQVVGLTSRGLDTRDATVRELDRQGVTLGVRALKVRLDAGTAAPAVADGSGLIFSLAHPERSGLTAELLRELGVVASRPVAYQGGVLFTDGQNKGVMLAALLARSGLDRAATIIFVDDRLVHVQAVDAVLTRLYPAKKVVAIHYRQSRAKVAAFEASDKGAVQIAACAVTAAFDRLWGARRDKPWTPCRGSF